MPPSSRETSWLYSPLGGIQSLGDGVELSCFFEGAALLAKLEE